MYHTYVGVLVKIKMTSEDVTPYGTYGTDSSPLFLWTVEHPLRQGNFV
jgi:hypothetical protein